MSCNNNAAKKWLNDLVTQSVSNQYSQSVVYTDESVRLVDYCIQHKACINH